LKSIGFIEAEVPAMAQCLRHGGWGWIANNSNATVDGRNPAPLSRAYT